MDHAEQAAMQPVDHRAVESLARSAVAALSPAEALLFDLAGEAFRQSGGRLPRRRASGGVEFDLGPGFASALAPIALAVGAFALDTLKDIVADLCGEAAKDAYRALRQRLTGSAPRDGEDRVPLPAEHLTRLRALIAAEAKRYLAPERADDLAEALVTRLAQPARER